MNIRYFILIIIFISILFAGCTPQIRFSSKQFPNNKAFTKEKVKSDSEIAQKAVNGINVISNDINSGSRDYGSIDFRRQEVLAFAESWLGTPYCYGGNGKSCTDCSGFVMEVFDEAGVKLPRTAKQQYEFGKIIEDFEMKPGDLVFFIRNNTIGHVGIYLGNNEFIHASSNNGVVVQNLDDSAYRQTFAGSRSIF